MMQGKEFSSDTIDAVMREGARRLSEAGVENAALDAALIVAETLGVDRLAVHTNRDRCLNADELGRIREMLDRRVAREPLAYILGRREFYGLDFEVTPDVLIPRPETELLVERAIAWIDRRGEGSSEPLIADIGTGSGAIAVAAAHERPQSQWIATDISEAALAVARRNAKRHGVDDRIEFRQGSLLEPIDEKLNAICCNPPYVAERDRETLALEVVDYEPGGALFAGPDGLDCIRALIEESPHHLRSGGCLMIECGINQSGAIASLLERSASWCEATVHKDLAGIDRVIEIPRI